MIYTYIKKLDFTQIQHILETSLNKLELLNPNPTTYQTSLYHFLQILETENIDLIRLCIHYGADINLISLCHTMYYAKLEVLQLFLELGVMNLFIGITYPTYQKIMQFYYPSSIVINIYTYVSPQQCILPTHSMLYTRFMGHLRTFLR